MRKVGSRSTAGHVLDDGRVFLRYEHIPFPAALEETNRRLIHVDTQQRLACGDLRGAVVVPLPAGQRLHRTALYIPTHQKGVRMAEHDTQKNAAYILLLQQGLIFRPRANISANENRQISSRLKTAAGEPPFFGILIPLILSAGKRRRVRRRFPARAYLLDLAETNHFSWYAFFHTLSSRSSRPPAQPPQRRRLLLQQRQRDNFPCSNLAVAAAPRDAPARNLFPRGWLGAGPQRPWPDRRPNAT